MVSFSFSGQALSVSVTYSLFNVRNAPAYFTDGCGGLKKLRAMVEAGSPASELLFFLESKTKMKGLIQLGGPLPRLLIAGLSFLSTCIAYLFSYNLTTCCSFR